MTVIDWYDTSYKNKVLRSGAGWSDVAGFIEDETLSGKSKRRYAHSMGKRQFSVKIRFTSVEDYSTFRNWFENVCRKGMYPFYYPMIDSTDNSIMKVYRFTRGGVPKYSNNSGTNIDCVMGWEEVQ